MKYSINYICWSDIGRRRSINQDNYFCGGRFIESPSADINYPLTGSISSQEPALLGVFDGMGGEECGEVASLIASKTCVSVELGEDPIRSLTELCMVANERICTYANEHFVSSMGTTAAMLAFGKKEIELCNIGDSKIFRLSGEEFVQLSTDHYAHSMYGKKPPLSQCLGIPPTEMVIEPYSSSIGYRDGDIYLICSDGLTDMVPNDRIASIITGSSISDAAKALVQAALDNGGIDNITVILCKIEAAAEAALHECSIAKAPKASSFSNDRECSTQINNRPKRKKKVIPLLLSIAALAVFTAALLTIPKLFKKPADDGADSQSVTVSEAPTAAIDPAYSVPASENIEFTDEAFKTAVEKNDIDLNDIEAITELDLSGAELTDISDIVNFKGLEILLLDNNDVSDYSPLKKLERLRVLSVKGCSDEQYEELKLWLPSCEVSK